MKRFVAFILVALIGWNALLSIQLYQIKQDRNTLVETGENVDPNVQHASVEITSDITKLVEKSENSVVTISSYRDDRLQGTGSGAIYKVKDKVVYIITNNHVVEKAQTATVAFANGKSEKAEIVGTDVLTDLAVLKVNVDFEAKAFVAGDSSLCKKGEYVIAMGSPLGIEYQGSVSGGLISGLNRRMELDTDNDGVSDWDLNVIQTDAAINPGNSGGPLINMAGELIGINSMKISAEEVEGFGFALPINEVMPIVSQLENNGRVVRPILGISITPLYGLTALEKFYYGINTTQEEGLYIVKVASHSPAAKAGIREGDILLKLDDKEIQTMKQFRQYLYTKKVGDEIVITYEHHGKTKEKTVILE